MNNGMTVDAVSFRMNKFVADVDIDESMLTDLFDFKFNQIIDLYTDELIYVCKAIVEKDFSDITIIIYIDEKGSTTIPEYTAKLSSRLKEKFIKDFKQQFLNETVDEEEFSC